MKIKDKIASGLGSVLEWYDFSLYGFFAPLLAELYFPTQNLSTGLIHSFSAFAVGFFARPIGALIFGFISDKYGRKISLKMTPLLITIPTFFFCLLPTYQQIGIIAPILLVLLRIWQGICIGGEYANNIVYLCERTPRKHLFFTGSIGSCTGSTGIMLASLISAGCYSIFNHEMLYLWGWRLAFSISIFIGVISYFMRRNMEETEVFRNIQKDDYKNLIYSTYKYQWQDYLTALGLTFLPATAFYFVFMFLPNFIAKQQGSHENILGDNSISLLLRILIIPIVGFIADKTSGRIIAIIASIAFILLSAPLFYNIACTAKISNTALYIFALLTSLNAGTTPGLLIELLKPETRCIIFSVSFNICFGIFGGITPVICFLLTDKFQGSLAPIFYLILAAIITLTTAFCLKRKEPVYG